MQEAQEDLQKERPRGRSPNPSTQSRLWLNVNFEEADQFTAPTLVCQYCFRLIGLDQSLETLTSELRRKPLISVTSTYPSQRDSSARIPLTSPCPDYSTSGTAMATTKLDTSSSPNRLKSPANHLSISSNNCTWHFKTIFQSYCRR